MNTPQTLMNSHLSKLKHNSNNIYVLYIIKKEVTCDLIPKTTSNFTTNTRPWRQKLFENPNIKSCISSVLSINCYEANKSDP